MPWENRAQAEVNALKLLEEREIDFVVLARFMKILSPNFVWRYKNKIINIHPSLLPSFPGPQAYRQAYEHGVKIAGVIAHFVNMHLYEGPIIAQGSFHIRPGMTLPEIVATRQKLGAGSAQDCEDAKTQRDFISLFTGVIEIQDSIRRFAHFYPLQPDFPSKTPWRRAIYQ